MWKCPKCGREFRRAEQSHYCGAPPAAVDEYIEAQPEEVRPALRQVRDAIRAAIPEAGETISWSMPTWRKGRNLIHFAAQKKHIGLYPGEEAVAAFAEDLKGYQVSKGTVRLPYDRPVPAALIGRIARWCLEKYGR